ncbi:MAG TPA: hypothetical protein VGN16_06975 [Acidobacteriaceae bacterium]
MTPRNTAIFREPTPAEVELSRLRLSLAAKRSVLTARELALGNLRGQLFSFEGRYIRQVGLLYKQLDEWNQRIADLHSKQTDDASFEEEWSEADELLDAAGEEAAPASALDLRVLFRELAKRIHPDFAADDIDERRRTRLMAQANDAFLRKDHRTLQRMLHGFDPPEALSGAQAIEAETAYVLWQTEQVEQDIAAAEADHQALACSDLAKLRDDALQAALKSRDLLAEMAARVKGQIGLAMRQYELDLDRIKRPPKGPSVETLVTAETYRQPRYDAKRGVWIK